MATAMVELERDDADPQALVERLLRAAHSIKGGAGFIGRRNLQRLAHALEEALENIRDARVARSPEVFDTLLAVLDRISAMVDDVEHSDDADISEPLSRLKPLLAPAEPTALALAPAPARQQPPSAGEFDLSDQLLQSWPAENAFLYGLKLDWLECEERHGLAPRAVVERIARAGTVLESQTRPSGPPLRDGLPTAPVWLLAVVSASSDLDDFVRAMDIPCAAVIPLRQKPVSEQRAPRVEESPRRAPAASGFLRVSVPLVDRMMSLAGELVLVRNQALRSAEPGNVPLRRLLRRLDSVTDELQDAALRMRTQPVGTLFDRFPRVVRDLARQLGKQIDVHITGAEVELDKTIIELLADPLTHMIRNCCDHGIETPAVRSAAGKIGAGRIDLSARQERGQIVIEIRDDGRGIDAQAVKRKALEQRLKSSEELDRMGERQIFGLILTSGFSTAAKVTDLSGRGVGMDVVRTNLDQIGGVIEIDSHAGRGSIFTLRLPLTLAIMPCLLVSTAGQCYGVPQRDVEEILLLGSESSRFHIERTHESEVLRWRGRLLPIVRAQEILRRREPLDAAAIFEIAERFHRADATGHKSYALVIRLGSRRFAIVFDDVIGSENIVVKPLHPLLRPLGIYAAATILGDGNVALIVSADGVARHGGVVDLAASDTLEAAHDATDDARREPVLLFRCGPEELLAARMDSVRRVVTISPADIERVGDRELVNVDGTATRVVRIDKALSLSKSVEADRMFLLLPRKQIVPAGLLVSQIIDTPSLVLDVDTRAYAAPGVLGSLMIEGDIALVIDVDRIAESASGNGSSPVASRPRAARILVVDDTAFFRKLVAEHLRGAGYEVTLAEDGSAGLSMLRQGPFDAVVSDIEMPQMDGHALARAVRADPQVAHTALLALTTLNTPESRASAAASGFDEYEVKLDRDSLLSKVRALLQRRPAR